MAITSSVEKISPILAQAYLDKNCINRNPSIKRVNTYARDMENGNWKLNGETIIFDEDGKLINGQHRLMAVIQANVPVDFLVVRGVQRDATLQDRGRNRSAIDAMLMNGFDRDLANNTTVALVRLHFAFASNKNVKNMQLSDSEIEQFLLEHEYIIRRVFEYTHKKRRNVDLFNICSGVICLPCIYAISNGESFEDVFSFIDILKTGVPTSLNQSAAIVCRNDIISNAISTKGGAQDRMRTVLQIEKAIYDFCHHYKRIKTYRTWNKQVYRHVFAKDIKEDIA